MKTLTGVMEGRPGVQALRVRVGSLFQASTPAPPLRPRRKSLDAKDAEVAKEQKSFNAEVVKDAKTTPSRFLDTPGN
jgi:hypothetical protein